MFLTTLLLSVSASNPMNTLPVTSSSQLPGLYADQTNFQDMRANGDCPTTLGLTPAQVAQVDNGTHQVDWSSGKK